MGGSVVQWAEGFVVNIQPGILGSSRSWLAGGSLPIAHGFPVAVSGAIPLVYGLGIRNDRPQPDEDAEDTNVKEYFGFHGWVFAGDDLAPAFRHRLAFPRRFPVLMRIILSFIQNPTGSVHLATGQYTIDLWLPCSIAATDPSAKM